MDRKREEEVHFKQNSRIGPFVPSVYTKKSTKEFLLPRRKLKTPSALTGSQFPAKDEMDSENIIPVLAKDALG